MNNQLFFEIISKWIPIVFVVSLVLIIVWLFVNDHKSKKKDGGRKETPEEHLEREAEYSECRARLVKMQCGVDVRGTKRVFVSEKYFITFELEDGSTVDYGVDEEIYELLEEGMEGTLVTVEGNFFGFEADN